MRGNGLLIELTEWIRRVGINLACLGIRGAQHLVRELGTIRDLHAQFFVGLILLDPFDNICAALLDPSGQVRIGSSDGAGFLLAEGSDAPCGLDIRFAAAFRDGWRLD